LEVARKTFFEDDEFRKIGAGSGILRPIRRDLPRESGVAGEDQNGRAIHAYRRFLALQIANLRPQRQALPSTNAASRVSTGNYCWFPPTGSPEATGRSRRAISFALRSGVHRPRTLE